MEDHIVARTLAAASAEPTTLAAVVYRSRADGRLSPGRLGELLETARTRNARENLSGLLLYDGEHFLQWLEGPAQGVDRVWSSIQADDRHSNIELLGRPRLPVRLFRGWEMGLAGHTRSIAEGVDDVVLVDQGYFDLLEEGSHSLGVLVDLLARVAPTESVLSTAPTFDERSEHVRVLCMDHVLPMVQARHGVDVEPSLRRRSATARLPRIDPAFIERFTDHVRDSEQDSARRVWQRLVGLGCSTAALCSDLLEPAARRLGDLWAADACTGADLVMAEAELLMLIRRGTPPLAPRARPSQPKVVVASPPGSGNVLGPALAAARLEALQCLTECLHPETDEELDLSLARTDAQHLVLAMDPVHALSVDPERLDRTVLAAREAVQNRGLKVLLYGRQVASDPHINARAHADSAFATLAEFGHGAVERF